MKTITINDIKVKEFSIAKDDKNNLSINIVYSMVDDGGKEVFVKRADLKELALTTIQKKSIEKVETLILDTIKTIEHI